MTWNRDELIAQGNPWGVSLREDARVGERLKPADCKSAVLRGFDGSNPSPCTKIRAVTDGSCLKNPGGPGGWAVIFQFSSGGEHTITGRCLSTTNNRMEIQAAIEALDYLADGAPAEVEIVTDSEYLRRGATEWMSAWKRRGWKTKGRQGHDVMNRDLWEKLDHLLATEHLKITWTWVRGHDKHEENNRCDELAGKAARGIE